MILVGDIGGTKTRLALFAPGSVPDAPLREEVYASFRYASLEDLVGEFLASESGQVEAAAFGVAGPVAEGRVKLTNLPWIIDQEDLAVALAIPRVVLINDVMATAAALPHLGPASFFTLQEGQEDTEGNMAVVAAGTGLGEAFLTRSQDRWQTHATEGGHADFAPRDDEQWALWQHLRKHRDHISCETVCAGSGIEQIYRYLYEVNAGEADTEVLSTPDDAGDVVPRIVAAALQSDKPCPLCVRTLDLYVSLLGAEAGNLAIKIMATGGVYLGGGIPPRILPFLQKGGFLRSFNDKGRMSELTACMPVRVILDPRVALLGVAYWFWENEIEAERCGCREKSQSKGI
jgi:glucokinase